MSNKVFMRKNIERSHFAVEHGDESFGVLCGDSLPILRAYYKKHEKG